MSVVQRPIKMEMGGKHHAELADRRGAEVVRHAIRMIHYIKDMRKLQEENANSIDKIFTSCARSEKW